MEPQVLTSLDLNLQERVSVRSSAKPRTTTVGAFRGCLVFLTWTLTSFVCHFAAKQFLNQSHEIWREGSRYVDVMILTFFQISTCVIFLNVHFLSEKCSPDRSTGFLVLISHVLSTMATNFSMTLVQADSTFADKLMEPITSAVINTFIIGTVLTCKAYCSLPLIVIGAVGFNGNPFTNRMLGLGAWYAFLSNVILATRNLGIKFLNKENQFTFRSYKIVVAYCTIISVIGLLANMYLSNDKTVLHVYTYLIVSATFHVFYSYVSTGIVLQYMSVVSHSVATIWKRILVVLLLYFVGQRHASIINIFSLLVCMTGLFLYVYGQSAERANMDTAVPALNRKRLNVFFITVVFIALLTNCVPSKQNGWQKFKLVQQSLGIFAYDDRSSVRISPKVQQNISWRLIDHYNETNTLSSKLTSTEELLREVKRVTLSLTSDIFGSYKYAFLLDMAPWENKGDPAMNFGQLTILRDMNIELLFHCHFNNCTEKALDQAKQLSTNYRIEELVVLCSGGGNMGDLYRVHDYLRFKIIQTFPDHKIVIFPQTTWFQDANHLNACKMIYTSHKDLVIMLRDKASLESVRIHFPKSKSYLVPDAALSIGPVQRFMPPLYDIIWLRRSDFESPKYKLPPLPTNLTVTVSDWLLFKSPSGANSMETPFLMTTTGFMFLQRGRVLITDRLHGHILAVLLNLPHVIIDNQMKKLTNFRNTWTAALENVRVAKDAEDAVVKAVELLQEYDNVLPRQIAFMKSLDPKKANISRGRG